MWATLTLMTALGVTPGQAGELRLTNDRVTYGRIGPTRTDKKFLPGDAYFLSFDIEGLTKEKGLIRYTMKMEILDGKGKPRFTSRPEEREVFDILGADRVPAFAHTFLGIDAEPGEYTLKLTVTDDQATKKSQTLVRKFEVGERDFGLVGVNLTYPGEVPGALPIPAPPVVVLGQPLILSFGITGFERDAKTKQPRVRIEMRALDGDGKPTLAKPITDEIVKNVDAKTTIIDGAFDLYLNRPGKFTVELKATDVLTNKSWTVALPMTVLEAPK
jgi:hypothetical protein